MSISRTVYLRRAAMLRPKDWASAIRASGFDMDMDADFEVEKFSGFLPCKYGGHGAGFEYFFSPVAHDELGEDLKAQLEGRDVGISFVTHSDIRGLATAVVAAAVLSEKTDGLVHDEEADQVIQAKDAVADARELIESIRDELR